MGYKVLVAREKADGPADVDHTYWVDHYLGWARSVNLLIKLAMEMDSQAQWFVTGGDDYIPDLAHPPQEIAEQCSQHFLHQHIVNPKPFLDDPDPRPRAKPGVNHTFGVMQPTGDRWGLGKCTTCNGNGACGSPEYSLPFMCADCQGTGRSALIDRICGSPWIGREFARRVNGGNGPLWPEYFHNFADEELQNVARRLGVLWQWPDLIHYHRHHARIDDLATAPDWIKNINDATRSDWRTSEALFKARKAAGFPGHEPKTAQDEAWEKY